MKKPIESKSCETAFTRIDLLVTTLIIGMLVSLHGLSHANGRAGSRDLQCMANLRVFAVGMLMYAGDNESQFPSADNPQSPNGAPNWGPFGWLDLPASSRDNVDPFGGRFPLSDALLWDYFGSTPTVWRCPSDPSTGSHPDYLDGAEVPRVRSYSMNGWIGNRQWNSGGELRQALPDVVDPNPDTMFNFICERADGINDGYFIVEMSGYRPDSVVNRGAKLVDFPSFYHERGFNLGFIDGHVENRQLKDPRTNPPYFLNQEIQLNVDSPDNPDVHWLQQRATKRL